MKSTHPARTTQADTLAPVHPSQIREDVKQALSQVQEKLKAEDQALEDALLASHRSVRLNSSVPEMVNAALSCHGISLRRALELVAIQTGFHVGHVRRIYYRTKANQPHIIRLKKGDQP